ncbi:hypothetical protein NHF40_12040 [Maricaulaceae bacterium EIL42A08]|nr:hypothetical protein [Maricaulaceae bacterium EIL42A08]
MLNTNRRERLESLAGRLCELDKAGIIRPQWLREKIRSKAFRLLRTDAVRRGRSQTWLGRLKASAGRRLGLSKGPDTLARTFAERFHAVMAGAGEAGELKTLSKLEGLVTEHWQLSAIEMALRETLLDVLDLPLDALEGEGFEAMLTAAIYRFAYGGREAVDYHNSARTTDIAGAYQVYLKESGSGIVERRVLAWALLDQRFRYDGAVRAVELSREDGDLIVRAGVVIPNQGHDAMTLSQGLDSETADAWLRETFEGGDEPLFSADDVAERPQRAQTQSNRLGFLSVRTRSPGKILGAFLDGERHGQLVGRRLRAGDLNPKLIASLGSISPGSGDAALSDDDKSLIASMQSYTPGPGGYMSDLAAQSSEKPAIQSPTPTTVLTAERDDA